MRRPEPKRRRRGEEGSSLVLALAMLTLLGVYGTMLLGYGWTGMRETVVVAEQRASSYAADGGLTSAIAVVRNDVAQGRDAARGGSCGPVVLPDAEGGPVGVTCAGLAGSGAVVPGVNAPNHAVLAFGTGGESGVQVQGAGTLAVDGAVFSHSSVSVARGATLSAGPYPATIRGACSGTIVANPVRCAVGNEARPEAADPGYASPLTVLPTYRVVPTCSGPNGVVTLEPGFYDDAAALTRLTNGQCPGTLVWLRPGVYYFDFDLDARRTAVWSVNDASVNVVGGTPKGWSPAGRAAVPIPGGCATNGEPSPNDGVSLVFGGGSRLQVTRGSVELCATPSETGQQIVAYGQRSGATPAPVTNPARAARVSDTPGIPGSTPYQSPRDAATIAEVGGQRNAEAWLPQSSDPFGRIAPPQVASLTFQGFWPDQPPAGAVGVQVRLRVRHAEEVPPGMRIRPRAGWSGPPGRLPPTSRSGGGRIVRDRTTPYPPGTVPTGSFTLQATVRPGDGSPACTVAIRGTARPLVAGRQAFEESRVDVTGCADTAAKRSGLTVRYDVTADAGTPITEFLDGIELEMTYTPPGLRAQSGCVVAPRGCAWLSSGAGGRLQVQGTLYAPAALVDLDAAGAARSRVSRGVILRVLVVRRPGNGSSAIVGLGARREVELTASADGRRRARALVRIYDSPVPGQTVEIREWGVIRD